MTSIEAAVWDDIAGIGALVPQWRTLRGAGITTIFGSPEWVLAAWQHLPSLGKPLLLTACSNGQLLAVLPLAVTRRPDGTRLLRYAGSPLTDKCDALVAPGKQDLAAEGILHAVRSALSPQDVLRVSELDREGLLADVLARRDLRNDFGLTVEWHAGDLSPVIPITRAHTMDRRWPPASRRKWDNRRRWLARQGNLRFARQTSMRDFEPEMRAFVRRRLDRWDQRGRLDELPDVEREAGFEEFLTQCSTRLAARGCCFLAHLLLDHTPVASDLYFRYRGVALLYMRTYDPRWSRASPGHLLFLDAAATIFDEGISTIELGRGDERYKYRLGALDAALVDAHISLTPVEQRR